MLTPKVNINGTSRDELVRLRLDARAKIMGVIEALAQMRPHGRDYLGDVEAYTRDRDTHEQRISTLDKLYNELEEEALAIQNS